jgi:hypothetical protein
MDFDTVRADLLCREGAAHKRVLKCRQIFSCRCQAIRLPRADRARRAQQRILSVRTVTAFLSDGSFVAAMSIGPPAPLTALKETAHASAVASVMRAYIGV